MGVIGASCQLCGLPLQHDHYLPQPDGMLRIYRGAAPDGVTGSPAVPLGPEHAWLADAVVLTNAEQLLAGPVEDGVLVDAETGASAFVWEGGDDGFAYHRACWDAIGAPRTLGAAAIGHGTHAHSLAEMYSGQLFELAELCAHGKAWMLADPRGTTAEAQRSRARIAEIVAAGPPPTTRPSLVTEVLATDRGWRGVMQRQPDHLAIHTVRYRTDLTPELADLADYPVLVWAMKEYGEGMATAAQFEELDAFEHALKRAVEADAAAVLVMVTVGRGQGQYLIHARDEAVTRAAVDALPGAIPLAYDNERDPDWHVYFRQMRPGRG